MKNRKKVKNVVIAAVAATGVVGGGIAGVTYVKDHNSKTVEVTPVSMLNMGDMASDMNMDGTSGTVVSNVSQSIRIPDGKVIDKVYVQEGDKVKIGDKLISYDTTLLELDKELQEITVMELGLEIKSAEADLAKLQSAKPGDKIPDNMGSSSSGSVLDNLEDNSSDDDSSDEEARLITNTREMLAAQEEEVGTEETAATSPETESDTNTADNGNVQSSEGENSSESEVVIDQTESENHEVLTPDDLNQSSGSEAGTESESDQKETDADKAKHNQSLEKFFTNVRLKVTEDGNENLLADIRQGEQAEVAVENDLKLIPHFSETTENHFRKSDTYTMYIYGVKLDQQISGKVYGTAQINGEDYPEIGGFTLAQKNGSEDTVQLTIAFHDVLEQQHEKNPELEDMYLELSLKANEILGERLTLRTAGEEKDAVFVIPERTQESESEIISDETEQETETEEMTISEKESETESETQESESESESEISGGQAFELQNLHFKINWNHGNNAKDNWPSSMKAYFYQNGISGQEDPDCTFTLTQGSSAMAGTDTGIDGTDTTIEEEVSTEPMTEASSENESGSDVDSETEEATDITEVIPDEDSESSHQTWGDINLKIPDSIKLNSEQLGIDKSQWSERWAAYAPNYFMEIADIQTSDTDASATIVINMTYTKPADDPLIKLNPISELTWEHGVNTENGTGMRAYKGSGTSDDPYVFFVKDGVKITNTFVNWVLGFNSEGTERIGDGYYVRLEIRESDTITGAFIRSIDLDGTILTDHGYGPGTYWIFNSETGITKYEEEVPDDGSFDPGGDPGWGNDNDGSTYTAEELAQAIAEKKLEIQKLKLDERQANLKLKNYNKQMEESTVVSAVDGYVKSINGSGDDAYMVVDSENGLYVKTTVGELELENIAVDEVINCSSWDTGAVFTAKITEIDAFPASEDSSDYYGSSGNVNSSNYPVLAVIDEETAENLSEYESVSVNYPSASTTDSNSVYIEKAYIRSENGQSYVYIADENGKLKKQYVRTGGTLWGYYIEVKQGLSTDDQIAFPYGKAVKEGAAVKLTNEDE